MTRAMFDAQQDMNTNFTFGNVAGATIENLAAKPTIAVEAEFLRNPVTKNANGRIVYVKSTPGTHIEFGPSRHKVWFVDGYIQYTNISKFDDATIMAIFAEMERVMNVNNGGNNTYTRTFVTSEGYDRNPVDGQYNFTVEVMEIGVSSYT